MQKREQTNIWRGEVLCPEAELDVLMHNVRSFLMYVFFWQLIG